LREARGALTDGDLVGAARALDGLDQRYPEGLLLEERRALRAMTNCKAGTTRQGGTVFLQRYPASIYAAKVRRTCGLESASPSAGVTGAPSAGH
jgi:outer membrane protein assembly factor BamD (BamD/ComL family)